MHLDHIFSVVTVIGERQQAALTVLPPIVVQDVVDWLLFTVMGYSLDFSFQKIQENSFVRDIAKSLHNPAIYQFLGLQKSGFSYVWNDGTPLDYRKFGISFLVNIIFHRRI